MKTNRMRVYALLGPDSGDKSVFLREIRANLKNEFQSDPELHRFYPFETTNGEIFEVLQNNSLFSDHRLVILSQMESMNQQLIAPLVSYVSNPIESATLVLISEDYKLKGKLDAAVPKDGKKIFYEMYEYKKPAWVRNLFKPYRVDVEESAISLLLELVENDTAQLRQAVVQLMQYLSIDKVERVREEDVERYVQHTRVESVFTLFEAIATKGYQAALEILHALMRDQDNQGILLINGLLWSFRRLLSVQENLSKGKSWEESTLEASVLGKRTSIKRKSDHEIYRGAVALFTITDTRNIIGTLGSYDIKLREFSNDLELFILEEIITTIMIHRGKEIHRPEFLSITTDAKF
ncbi:MAG: DNA polymerase III subunit delta [Spirochaetia bacterium]|nr:DNA polymerase III subunit delta [Spirochaetia bacterium]